MTLSVQHGEDLPQRHDLVPEPHAGDDDPAFRDPQIRWIGPLYKQPGDRLDYISAVVCNRADQDNLSPAAPAWF
jgi:hypothetical protein